MGNEFVMVPRAELARLQENMDPHRGAVAWGIVCDLLAQPAEQHQGEPVDALLLDDCVEHKHPGYGVGYFGTEIVKLYRGADAGEVERLRNELGEAKGAYDRSANKVAELRGIIRALEENSLRQTDHLAYMRAQLAERDALLREADDFMYAMTGNDTQRDLDERYGQLQWEDAICKLRGRIACALSASAEPVAPKSFIACRVDETCGEGAGKSKCETCSDHGIVSNILNAEPCPDCSYGAPGEIDEQDEFMAWANKEYEISPDEELNLKNPSVRDNKIGWLARSALERKPFSLPEASVQRGGHFYQGWNALLEIIADQLGQPVPESKQRAYVRKES